jgi:hypothetical protein
MTENQPIDDNLHELVQAVMWLDKGIKEGLRLLQEDLERHSSYDPHNKPYDEKNAYIGRSQAYGGWLLTERFFWAADLYYRRMLDEILAYEQATQKRFNKGIAYANLGIAQIAQGKFDAGIAHLLTAEWEDRELANPKEFILDSILWEQFEAEIFVHLMSYRGRFGINFTVDAPFLQAFFKSIPREDRIFLEGTLLALFDNVIQHNVQANSYTYGRLYSFLKDLCLLIESLLRNKQVALGSPQPSDIKDLYNLLVKALKNQNIIWPQPNSPLKANNLQEFVNSLDSILNSTTTEEIRRTNVVYLVRNFTGHHFRVDENIKSSSGKSFFGDFYIPALENTIAHMLYLKHINAI